MWEVDVQRLAISVNSWCQVYFTHCISDHEFCQDPCSLVTTVASDNRNGWSLLSLGMQGFDRLIMSRDNFQLRQTKNVNTTNIFRPYSYRAWILEGFFNWKIHTWKWKLQFGGELLWDHQAGTSSNTKSNFQKAIETWKWDETVNEFLPTKLTDKGSPFVTIWSNPWYFYLENQLCLSASTTFVSFDGRGTQQALKIVWRSPPWFPESLAGFWCLETIQERRSLWSPAKINKLQDSHRFTLS